MLDLGPFLGRLHPFVVHLPIGFLLLLGVLELAGRLARNVRRSWIPPLTDGQRGFILWLGALTTVAAALSGWQLTRESGYDPTLLGRHRGLGIAVAASTVFLLLVHARRWRRAYGAVLAANLVLVAGAGHAGGTITHGRDYLAGHLPVSWRRLLGVSAENAMTAVPADPRTAHVFADVIQPILRQRCVACHGPEKSNGKLRCDTWEFLRLGGKHGPALKPADAAGSLMVRRAFLPLESKEHMPPKGKPQLSDDELALIEWWINTGASRDATVAALESSPQVREILVARYPSLAPTTPLDRAATLALAADLASQLGIVINPIGPDGPWLAASARLKFAAFGDAELARLQAIAPALQALDLGETAVTDTGLMQLAAMKHLRRLHLDRTPISDAGLASLSGLDRLEYLNLHGTAISDRGMAALQSLPRLRSLYLWQTGVTSAAASALGRSLVDQRKITRWEDEMRSLQRKIDAERFTVNFGESIPVASLPKPNLKTAAPGSPDDKDAPKQTNGPDNATCPVSGEPVDPAVTAMHQGRTIAFCCQDCREKFRAHPEKYPAALE